MSRYGSTGRYGKCLATTLLLILSPLCKASPADMPPGKAPPVTQQIELAYQRNDLDQLKRIRDQAYGLEKSLAGYRQALMLISQDQRKQAKEVLRELAKDLDAATEAQPEDAEASAILANVYGLMIHLNPVKAPLLGFKASGALESAKAGSAGNPRVKLLLGIDTFNKPAMFGGSKEEALRLFTEAIEAFNKEAKGDRSWGHADSYVWRGIAFNEMGDEQKAKQDWQAALLIAPEYEWPKGLLHDL